MRHAKLMEVIDEVGVQVPAVQPCDIPAELQDVYMYKASLVGTKKPIHSLANSEKRSRMYYRNECRNGRRSGYPRGKAQTNV